MCVCASVCACVYACMWYQHQCTTNAHNSCACCILDADPDFKCMQNQNIKQAQTYTHVHTRTCTPPNRSTNSPPLTAVLHLSCLPQSPLEVGPINLWLALLIHLHPLCSLLFRDLLVRPVEEGALFPVTACRTSKEPPGPLLLKEALKQQGRTYSNTKCGYSYKVRAPSVQRPLLLNIHSKGTECPKDPTSKHTE